MDNFDLESILRTARTPDRPDEYWERFPARVLARAQTRSGLKSRRASWFQPLAWCGAMTAACLLMGLGLAYESRPALGAFWRHEKSICLRWEQLPDRLRVVMQDEHGLHRLVADQS